MVEAVMPGVFGVGNPGSEKETAGFEMQTTEANEHEFEQDVEQRQADVIRRNVGKEGESNPTLEQALGKFENIQNESLKSELNGLFEAVNDRYKLDQQRLVNPEKIEKIKDFLFKIGDQKIVRNITIGGVANFLGGMVLGAQAKTAARKMLFAAGVKGAVAAVALGASFGAARAGWRENRAATKELFGAQAWEKQLDEHRDNPEEQMGIIKGLLADQDYQKYLKANPAESIALLGRYQEIALSLDEKRLEEHFSKTGETTPSALTEYLKTAGGEKRARVLRAIGQGAKWGAIVGLAGYGVGQMLGHVFHGTPAEAQSETPHGQTETPQAAAGPPSPFQVLTTEPASLGNAHPEISHEHLIDWRMAGDHARLAIDTNTGHFAVNGQMESIVDVQHGGGNHEIAQVIAKSITEGQHGGHFDMTAAQKLSFEKSIEGYLNQHPNAIHDNIARIPATELNHALDHANVHIEHISGIHEPAHAPTDKSGEVAPKPEREPTPEQTNGIRGGRVEGHDVMPRGGHAQDIQNGTTERGYDLRPRGAKAEDIPPPVRIPTTAERRETEELAKKIQVRNEALAVLAAFAIVAYKARKEIKSGAKKVGQAARNAKEKIFHGKRLREHQIEQTNEFIKNELTEALRKGKRIFIDNTKFGEIEILGVSDDRRLPLVVLMPNKEEWYWRLTDEDLRNIRYEDASPAPSPGELTSVALPPAGGRVEPPAPTRVPPAPPPAPVPPPVAVSPATPPPPPAPRVTPPGPRSLNLPDLDKELGEDEEDFGPIGPPPSFALSARSASSPVEQSPIPKLEEDEEPATDSGSRLRVGQREPRRYQQSSGERPRMASGDRRLMARQSKRRHESGQSVPLATPTPIEGREVDERNMGTEIMERISFAREEASVLNGKLDQYAAVVWIFGDGEKAASKLIKDCERLLRREFEINAKVVDNVDNNEGVRLIALSNSEGALKEATSKLDDLEKMMPRLRKKADYLIDERYRQLFESLLESAKSGKKGSLFLNTENHRNNFEAASLEARINILQKIGHFIGGQPREIVEDILLLEKEKASDALGDKDKPGLFGYLAEVGDQDSPFGQEARRLLEVIRKKLKEGEEG